MRQGAANHTGRGDRTRLAGQRGLHRRRRTRSGGQLARRLLTGSPGHRATGLTPQARGLSRELLAGEPARGLAGQSARVARRLSR
ncbi:MAG: hypothetical protein WAL41_04515, partial [Mycobacterium sp.]